jgi:hypothetical protein
VTALLFLIVGTVVTWAVVRADAELGASAKPSSSATSAPGPSASSSSSATSAPSATTATSPTTDAALAQAKSALAACAASLTPRRQLARAAAASARDWRIHTDAQRKLDSGAWTLEQADRVWAQTQARGSADVKRFATAKAAVGRADGATVCRSVTARTAKTSLAAKGRACAALDRALAAAATTGSVVHGQWAEHLEMMAAKPHTRAAAYHDRWMSMVAAAPKPLKAYAAAADALARAPSCST